MAAARPPLLGGLPEHGIWTPLGLGREQFLAILALSIALFVFVDGPVWLHLHASHFVRITVSYGVIPLGVAAALAWNRRLSVVLVLGASAVIALIKLVADGGASRRLRARARLSAGSEPVRDDLGVRDGIRAREFELRRALRRGSRTAARRDRRRRRPCAGAGRQPRRSPARPRAWRRARSPSSRSRGCGRRPAPARRCGGAPPPAVSARPGRRRCARRRQPPRRSRARCCGGVVAAARRHDPDHLEETRREDRATSRADPRARRARAASTASTSSASSRGPMPRPIGPCASVITTSTRRADRGGDGAKKLGQPLGRVVAAHLGGRADRDVDQHVGGAGRLLLGEDRRHHLRLGVDLHRAARP